MAIPILKTWRTYFEDNPHEGLGSSYERVVLNLKLEGLRRSYGIVSCLEIPVFGFTGLSGINSLALAKSGVAVTLVDDDADRLRLIVAAWEETGEQFSGLCLQDYAPLPFPTKSFDLSWNFSALWFVSDVRLFLKELTRVTRKAVFLCVPNRLGMGFLSQKYFSGADLRGVLKEEHIIPGKLTRWMGSLNWRLVEANYIDAPPWPDIGMLKEDFLKRLGLDALVKDEKRETPLTIMRHYRGQDPLFPARMLRHYWFEQKAPRWVKALWSHHRYLLFEPMEGGSAGTIDGRP